MGCNTAKNNTRIACELQEPVRVVARLLPFGLGAVMQLILMCGQKPQAVLALT